MWQLHHNATNEKLARIGLVLCACIVSGFFSNTLLMADPVIKAPPGGAPATVSARAIRFSVPAGFIDATNYSYASPSRKEMVSLNLEELNPSPSPLDEIYEDKKKSLLNVMEGRIHIISEGRTRMADTMARTILFAFSDKDSVHVDHWAIGVAGQTMILLSYVAPEKNLDTFTHVARSVVLAPRHPRPAPAGFHRHQAGRIFLDLPENLREPRVYAFTSRDSMITITASFHDSKEEIPAMTLQDRIQRDSGNDLKKIRGLKESRVTVEGGEGREARYIVDDGSHPYRPRAHAVCSAVIMVGNERLHVYGKAPLHARAGLIRAWDEFLGSIKPDGDLADTQTR